jgi:glyoxylase-like metal-dependent hydrolase (beta-lactamase superfamily II)
MRDACAVQPVQLGDGVWRVPTAIGDLVNSFVFLGSDGTVVVVDAGFKRGGRRVAAALQILGKDIPDITHLVLTHAHMDHAGGAHRLVGGSPDVLAHRDDVACLAAGREPDSDPGSLGGRLVNIAASVWRRPWYPPVTVTRPLADGEVVPIAGGLRVIHTPGHTPGHMSLLHKQSGVLITGDAVVNVRGLRAAPRLFCNNLRQQHDTRSRLLDLDYDIAAFTHGAEVRTGAKAAVDEFIARDPRRR